jgi:hypothetical protein
MQERIVVPLIGVVKSVLKNDEVVETPKKTYNTTCALSI